MVRILHVSLEISAHVESVILSVYGIRFIENKRNWTLIKKKRVLLNSQVRNMF